VNHEGPEKEGEREGEGGGYNSQNSKTHTHTHTRHEHRETETESGACKRQKTRLEKQVSKLVVKMPITRAAEDIERKENTHAHKRTKNLIQETTTLDRPTQTRNLVLFERKMII